MDVGQTTVAKYMAKKTTAAVAGLEDLCSTLRDQWGAKDEESTAALLAVGAHRSRPQLGEAM
jgi:hypothetical protein